MAQLSKLLYLSGWGNLFQLFAAAFFCKPEDYQTLPFSRLSSSLRFSLCSPIMNFTSASSLIFPFLDDLQLAHTFSCALARRFLSNRQCRAAMGCSCAVRSFLPSTVSLPVTRPGQSWSDGYRGTEEHPLLNSTSAGDEGESHHLAVQDSGTESSMISLMHGVYIQGCTKINSPAAGKCGTSISGWALSKKYRHLAKNTAAFWALLLLLVEKNMKNICEEVCLAHQHLLWNTLQGFTFAMIYSSSVSRASEHCQCWNEKTESFPNSGLLWQAQSCHSLGSFFLFLDWVLSENKSCSCMDLCFWSQKYQLFCLFCEKHHWASTSVDQHTVVYSASIYHFCVRPKFIPSNVNYCCLKETVSGASRASHTSLPMLALLSFPFPRSSRKRQLSFPKGWLYSR